MALGLLGAWLLLAVELLVVGALGRRQIASVWELELGTLWLLPTALCAANALGALGTLLYWTFIRADRPLERALHALGWATLAAGIAYGVGGGRHLATAESRGGFTLLVASVVGGAVWLLAPRLAQLSLRRGRVFALGVGLLLVGMELANARVLPRLYPAFHWGLAGIALLLGPWLALSWVPRNAPARAAWLLVWPLALLLPLLVVPSAQRFSFFDNFRLLLLEQAPILGRAVELAARVAPPEPLLDSCADGSSQSCGEPVATPRESAGVDFRGRDVLLVTIDALRADHVGAYGYARPTTPHIDRLAREGAVFEHAYAATPHTSYAVTSLMTGKHLRPLLLRGAGADSDTWASLLRTYGYRTAAFYPPAVFFIDTERFEPFQRSQLGFEYAKVEFAEGQTRLAQVTEYLSQVPTDQRLFMWVHLFGPHEPYVAHAEHPFGERDIDRYDSEIAEADATLGGVVQAFRAGRPNAVVMVTADHGEEFGEHGGRYHGTTVYEEQLRVPLVVSAPGAMAPQKIREVVQSIDVLPTVLRALDIPRPARVRGRDLGSLLNRSRAEQEGQAYGETDEHTLLARGNWRLICARKIGACKLHDLESDPLQRLDASSDQPAIAQKLRSDLKEITAAHGRYESQGLRAEGKGWPAPILRGIAGDADAAAEIASLLDDVDPAIRRKAAEILLQLRRPESAAALRLALRRDDDPEVRKLAALSLTRLGEGAPLVLELLTDPNFRRWAALALAESGDRRGLNVLLEWWRDAKARDFQRSRELLEAFATLRAKDAVPLLGDSLTDVRLRPYLARTLAKIGEESARVPLMRAFAEERSQSTRADLAQALIALGGREELSPILTRFLGVPDPLQGGLGLVLQAKALQYVGGPSERDLPRLRDRSELGTRVRMVVPKAGNGRGVRGVVRASCPKDSPPGELVLGSAAHLIRFDRSGKLVPERGVPALDLGRALRLPLSCSGEAVEVFGTLPDNFQVRPGSSVELIFFASRNVRVEALALVPLADELPPPPPRPWSKEAPGG